MSNSALATKYIPASDKNHYGARKGPIKKIIVHHAAGVVTAEFLANSFANPNRGASATYCIGYDGTIVRGLDESITPGTSSSYAADCDAVTIEVANSASGGNWPVSDKALTSLIKLCADIAKRNKLGALTKEQNLCWHSMYAATACPGPYLLSKMSHIAREANKINAICTGELSGTDIGRGTNALILYKTGLKKDGKTGTNMWGYEVAIDKNGIAIDNPKYKGNTTIPAGGCVLSGHGSAGKWIAANIKKGYRVTFTNNITNVVKKLHCTPDAINGVRLANYLVVFNKGTNAITNKWGYEVAIGKDGKATSNPVYGVGKMAIPTGGFVVSGHGKGGSWIYANIKKGTSVEFNGKYLAVK